MTVPKDGEQLRECINSGQVSAAQVVAHAENGEITTGWPAGMLQDDSKQLSKALSRDPNARALMREWKVGNELLPFHHQASHVNPDYRDGWNAAYYAALAAKQEEVARLRDILEANAALCIKRVAELTRKRNAEIETSKALREALSDVLDSLGALSNRSELESRMNKQDADKVFTALNPNQGETE